MNSRALLLGPERSEVRDSTETARQPRGLRGAHRVRSCLPSVPALGLRWEQLLVPAPGETGTVLGEMSPLTMGIGRKAQRQSDTHTRLFALLESWGKDSPIPTTRIRM